MNLADAAEETFRNSIASITIRSNLFPEIRVVDPLKEKPPKPPGPPGPPGKKKFDPIAYVGYLAQPQVIIATRVNQKSIDLHPFGIPGASRHKELIAGGVIFSGLALYGAYTLIKLALR